MLSILLASCSSEPVVSGVTPDVVEKGDTARRTLLIYIMAVLSAVRTEGMQRLADVTYSYVIEYFTTAKKRDYSGVFSYLPGGADFRTTEWYTAAGWREAGW